MGWSWIKETRRSNPHPLSCIIQHNLLPDAAPVMFLAQIGAEVFPVCLAMCYSKGEDSIRSRMDSISQTTYSDARKLLLVVADSMITGAGDNIRMFVGLWMQILGLAVRCLWAI